MNAIQLTSPERRNVDHGWVFQCLLLFLRIDEVWRPLYFFFFFLPKAQVELRGTALIEMKWRQTIHVKYAQLGFIIYRGGMVSLPLKEKK
jgi:hypothetical protein